MRQIFFILVPYQSFKKTFSINELQCIEMRSHKTGIVHVQ